MDYQDFEIEIASNPDGGYRVTSRSGTRRAEDIKLMPASELPNGHSSTGEKLFDGLFVGAVRDAYRETRATFEGRAPNEVNLGFRLRMLFGEPAATSASANPAAWADLNRFASHRWEALFDPRSQKSLALDGRFALVRTFDTEFIEKPFRIQGKPRLLLVSCDPEDQERLDLDGEARRIKEALDKNNFFVVERLHDPSFFDLNLALADADEAGRPFHILHFLGHGGINPATGVGHLCFVKERRTERRTSPELGQRLASFRSLRLVVLNSCRGAEIRPRPERSPFGTVALSLIESGIPAVVAMQDEITDPAAIAFAEAFYGSLLSSGRVEQAVTHGRQHIKDTENEGADEGEWELPALYLLPKDGRLFEHTRRSRKRGSGPKPLQIAIGSFDGWGSRLRGDYDWPLDLVPLFKGRFIDEPDTDPWNREVLSRLRIFLADHLEEGRPLHLRLDTHLSIAFAAGYLIDARAGFELTLEQPIQGQAPLLWRTSEGEVPEGPLWTLEEPVEFNPEAGDEALAISVSNSAKRGAEDYLRKAGLPVRVLHSAVVAGGAGLLSVKSGAHALRLAQELRQLYVERDRRPPGATLHVFVSCPKTFAFLLGQVAGPWRLIQLYEWDFRGEKHHSYEPSIRIDPKEIAPLVPKRAARG